MAEEERESRKRRLRENVIFGNTGKKSVEDEGESEEENVKSSLLKKKAVFLPLLFLVFFLAALLFYLFSIRKFTSLSVIWSTSFSDKESSAASFYPFSEGVVKVSKDGASYIGKTGKPLWNQAFEMGEPVVSVNGDFMVIGEENGSKLFILSKEGPVGQGEAPLPIEKLSISAKGVVYALLKEEDGSFITVFSKEGKNLDIAIKSVMSGDGYPIDFSVSKDGEELLVAFSYLDKSALKSRVVFYNFSSLGKNVGANRVVGGFREHFAGKMVGRVHFFNNEESFAAYNGGFSFFSTRVKTSPEEKKNEEIPGMIRMISYNAENLAVLADNTEDKEKGNYRLYLFRKSGEKVFDKAVSFMGTKMEVSADKIFLYQEKNDKVYDFGGRLRYNGETEEGLQYIRAASEINVGGTDLLLCFPNKVERVRVQ